MVARLLRWLLLHFLSACFLHLYSPSPSICKTSSVSFRFLVFISIRNHSSFYASHWYSSYFLKILFSSLINRSTLLISLTGVADLSFFLLQLLLADFWLPFSSSYNFCMFYTRPSFHRFPSVCLRDWIFFRDAIIRLAISSLNYSLISHYFFPNNERTNTFNFFY